MPKKRKRSRRKGNSRRRNRRRNKLKKQLILVGGIFSVIFLLFGMTYLILYQSVKKADNGKIAENVYIGKINVSGMDEEEAKEAISQQIEKYEEKTFTFQVEDRTIDASLKDLGLSMKDQDKLIKEAMDYGKTDGVFKRYNQLRKLKEEKQVIDDQFKVSKKKTEQIISEKAVPLENHATDASIKRVGNGFEITDEADGKVIDVAASIKAINQYLNEKWNYKDIKLKMVLKTEEPRIRRGDLESITDELGSFSTEAESGERLQNIKRAAELINGSILMPGDEFSVEKATVPYTVENGYTEGSTYENGKVVKSIGGGLCQMSSTLYNALLYAEVEITLRASHSMIVDYVEPSRDAAIAEGVKDLKFRNNYDSPILIEGYVDGSNRVHFAIYGKETRPESRKVEYESETLDRQEYTKKYVEDAESPIGSVVRDGTAINGRTARLWKVVYEDGKEISRKVYNNSKYKASEVKIKIGTSSSSAEASKIVRSAIGSQDQEKINAAISEAKNVAARSAQDGE